MFFIFCKALRKACIFVHPNIFYTKKCKCYFLTSFKTLWYRGLKYLNSPGLKVSKLTFQAVKKIKNKKELHLLLRDY
jgi:hypothetical protein